MIIAIDLDGTICSEQKTFERSLAKPLPGVREGIEKLIESGHEIVIYTARTWSEFKMTKAWLDDNNIQFHGLQMGKPVFDLWIDDRAMQFDCWKSIPHKVNAMSTKLIGGPQDEANLYLLRKGTVDFIQGAVKDESFTGPVLEIGPMIEEGKVFDRMPDTFINIKELVEARGLEYKSLDIDASVNPDIVGSFVDEKTNIESNKYGSVILLSCIEHIPEVWLIPTTLKRILKPGGRAYILTPWNLRFHGPRPDCWRISDDAYEALFKEGFKVISIEKINSAMRPLSPVGMTCIVEKI